MDGIGSNVAFLELLTAGQVVSMHTLEASLDDVFIRRPRPEQARRMSPLARLAVHDARLQFRYGIYVAYAFVIALYVAIARRGRARSSPHGRRG